MFKIEATITEKNEAKLSFVEVKSIVDTELKEDEVIIKVEACPINPSDLAILTPPGTTAEALKQAKEEDGSIIYPIDKKYAKFLVARVNVPTPAGNEGAGYVIKAGSSKYAQSLLNKVVSVAGARGMYSQFVKANVKVLMPHQEGTTPEEAASAFVNPVTALCIIDTVKSEGHKAFIHTAAASQLGVMLVKLCLEEKLPIVNVVRKEEQEKILRSHGAKYVVRSDKDTFMKDLVAAIHEVKATCAFDAIGGGTMAASLLSAMEAAAKLDVKVDPASFYGTNVYKQVYIYGGLDSRPTTITNTFGFCYGIGGWLLPNHLAKIGPKRTAEIFGIVTSKIKTTFKTEYFKKISLRELVMLENYYEIIKQETGKKFLVLPQKDVEKSKI